MGDKQVTRIRTAKALIQKSATTAAKQPLPTRVPVHPLLQLQRQIGNQAVTRLIQAKLTIGEPGDKYEQEADRVAAQVVSRINTPTPQQSSQGQTVQRQEMPADETLQTKAEISSIQRQEMPQEEELQTKPEISSIQRQEMPADEKLQTMPLVQRQPGGDGMAATPRLEASIQQARGGGQPLSDSIRKPMEQAFGADFSGVRVHTDATSDELNRSIQAKAFTTGSDIFFRQGAYEPSSRGGQELLAHELTHVVQQKGNRGREDINTALPGYIQRDVLLHSEPPAPAAGSNGTWILDAAQVSGERSNLLTDIPLMNQVNARQLSLFPGGIPHQYPPTRGGAQAKQALRHIIPYEQFMSDVTNMVHNNWTLNQVVNHVNVNWPATSTILNPGMPAPINNQTASNYVETWLEARHHDPKNLFWGNKRENTALGGQYDNPTKAGGMASAQGTAFDAQERKNLIDNQMVAVMAAQPWNAGGRAAINLWLQTPPNNFNNWPPNIRNTYNGKNTQLQVRDFLSQLTVFPKLTLTNQFRHPTNPFGAV